MIPPNIPLKLLSADPESLRRDFERSNQALFAWARGLPDVKDTTPIVAAQNGRVLAFGQLARLAPDEGQLVQLLLPSLDPKQGGKTIQLARLTSTGIVTITAPSNGRIDGVRRVVVLNRIGVTTIVYDGARDYLSDGTTIDVGAGL